MCYCAYSNKAILLFCIIYCHDYKLHKYFSFEVHFNVETWKKGQRKEITITWHRNIVANMAALAL